ncbi:MAG: AMP-binding protein [Vicinamibacterales bacterium]
MSTNVQGRVIGVKLGSLVLPGQPALSGVELTRRAGAVAAALRHAGVVAGQPVALATADPAAFVTALTACLASGFPAVVIDPLAAGDELRRMFARAAPAAAVVDGAVAPAVAEAGENAAVPLLVAGGAAAGRSGPGDWLPWRRSRRTTARWSLDAVSTDGADLHWAEIDEGATAYVMFTSGTTSTPKGVVISRRALFRHMHTLAAVFGYGPDATLLHYLPMHHTDGLVHGPVAALLTGMHVVRPGLFTSQTAPGLPALLAGQRITHFLAVPTILSMVLRLFADRADLFRTPSFRHVVSTAGYLPEALWEKFETTFGVRLSNFYGMTETVSGSLYCGPDDASYRRGTLGKPVDCRLRLVDDQSTACPPGVVGRLQIAGDHLMDGYLADPGATAAVLHDGWLDTGDLCRLDADGCYVFAGRRKAVIKRGGITVHPEDVRRVIAALDWVRDVEVIGVDDPTFEQIIVVCAVVDDGRDAAAIHAECAGRLAPERRPDRVVLMADLPRGPSGKVRLDALLERVSAAPPAETAAVSVLDVVRSVAAGLLQVDPSTITAATTPDDVPSWDSYAQIELAMALERRFGLRFTPKELMQMRSIGHVVAMIARRDTGR